MLRPGYLHVVRGPKENGYRPSIDALFRTAAASYGSRTVGVVLTGNSDCGTAGLLSITARGGLAIVQDPREAAVPEMPGSALRHVAVNHITPLADIGPWNVRCGPPRARWKSRPRSRASWRNMPMAI
jgi:two-component system chemotaxis response regulator CheB